MVISSRNLRDISGGWTTFFIQRLTRILPLYWLATSIKVAILLISPAIVLHSTFDLVNTINSYFFIPYKKSPNLIEPLLGVGWTLVFEMFFYLTFTVALLIRANIYIFVGAIMVLITVLSPFRPDNNYPVWMFLLNPIVLEFWFGMIVGYATLNNKITSFPIAVTSSILCCLFIIFAPDLGVSRVIMFGIPSAVLLHAIVSIEPYIQNKIPAPILFFGAASYSLYLFHPMIAPAIPSLLNKAHISTLSLSIILSVTASLIAAAIIYRYIELPITHATKRLPFISIYTHKPIIEMDTNPITTTALGNTDQTETIRDD